MARPYRMRQRAAAAEETSRRILAATTQLFVELPFHELTLQAVADRAGVTLQTVLRRFESKANLLAAVAAQESPRVAAQRAEAPVGDLRGAVANLFAHYEQWADHSLKFLAEESRFEEVAQLARAGREPPLVEEQVEMTIDGIQPETPHCARERVEAAAHVHRLRGDEDPDRRG